MGGTRRWADLRLISPAHQRVTWECRTASLSLFPAFPGGACSLVEGGGEGYIPAIACHKVLNAYSVPMSAAPAPPFSLGCILWIWRECVGAG